MNLCNLFFDCQILANIRFLEFVATIVITMNYFVIIIGFITKDHQTGVENPLKFENWNHISVTLQERNGFDVVRRSDFFSD
jgi:hypothetical protein